MEKGPLRKITGVHKERLVAVTGTFMLYGCGQFCEATFCRYPSVTFKDRVWK
jgi:hypothetical protein